MRRVANKLFEISYIFQWIEPIVRRMTHTEMPKLMFNLWDIITNSCDTRRYRKKVGRIQNIVIATASTHPNHLPLHTVLNKTRFRYKMHWAVMILSEGTNKKKIEMKLWTYKIFSIMKRSNNSTDPTLVTTTECPFGRVTVELCDGEKVLNNCREQHIWCVAPVSNT